LISLVFARAIERGSVRGYLFRAEKGSSALSKPTSDANTNTRDSLPKVRRFAPGGNRETARPLADKAAESEGNFFARREFLERKRGEGGGGCSAAALAFSRRGWQLFRKAGVALTPMAAAAEPAEMQRGAATASVSVSPRTHRRTLFKSPPLPARRL